MWRRFGDERGDLSSPIMGAFMTLFLIFAIAMFANVPRLIGAQQALSAIANGAAKDVAQQGCINSADLASINSAVSALGWNANNVTLAVNGTGGSALPGIANYNEPVTTVMTYAEPMVMFGIGTPWSWPLTAQGGPEPTQYVIPQGTLPSCTSDTNTEAALGSPNAYFYDVNGTNPGSQNVFAGTSQGTYGTTSGSGSSGTPALSVNASPSDPSTGETVTVTGQATISGTPQSGVTVDIVPSGGGAASTQAVTDTNGDYSASLTFSSTGTYDIAVTDGNASNSTSVTVGSPAVQSITVSAQSPMQDGASEAIYATITDSSGNPVPDGTAVQVSSTDSTDIPTQTLTTTNGEVALGVTWSQVGTWTVTFTAQGVQGSASVTVQAGSAQNLTLTGSPNPAQAGQAVTFSGTVTDSEGNPVASGTSVTLSSPTDSAECPAQTVTTGTGGTFSANCTFTVSGSQEVVVTSGGASTSTTVTVTSTGSSQFVGVALAPNPVDAGSELSASGTLQDAYGNPVANATVTMSGAGATDGTATTSSNGSFAVTITPENTGSQTITLTSGGATWTATVTVDSPSSADTVAAWVGTPGTTETTVAAGSSVTLGMTVTSSGSGVSGQSVTFTEPFVSGGGTWTCTTGSNGECSVVASGFTQTGTVVVQGEITNGETSDVQVKVTAGSAANISGFACSPTTVAAGAGTVCSGTVTDTYGNPVASSTVSLSGGGASATATTSSTGYFSQSLTLTLAGTDTITATDGAATATASITVTAGAPVGAIITNPTNGGTYYYGEPFQVTVQLADAYGNPITSLASGQDYSIGIAGTDTAGNPGPYCDLVGPTSTTDCTWQIGGYGAAPVNVPYTGYGANFTSWGSATGSGVGPDTGTWSQSAVTVSGTTYRTGFYGDATGTPYESYTCLAADAQCDGPWSLQTQTESWSGTTWFTALQEGAGQSATDSYGDGGITYVVPSTISAGFEAGQQTASPPLPASTVPGSTVSFTAQTFMPSKVTLTVLSTQIFRDNEIEVGGAYGYDDAGTYCADVTQTNAYGLTLPVGIMQSQPNSAGKGYYYDIYPGSVSIPNGGSAWVCGGSMNGITYYPTESAYQLLLVASPPGQAPYLAGASTAGYASSGVLTGVYAGSVNQEFMLSPYGFSSAANGTTATVTYYLQVSGTNASSVVGQTYSVSCAGYNGDTVSCPSSVTMSSTYQSFSVQVTAPYNNTYGNVVVTVQVGGAYDQQVQTDVNFD